MNHRKDIDGLRSLAILPVVWYHAGLPGLPGGFVGVDIFFVISGFLITGILFQEFRSTGKISFLNFYQRRARRILPALFFMLLLANIIGLFVLDAQDYGELQLQVLSAMFFVSNIYFDQTIDYFSNQAELLLLLHTWSLSVEEQFYLIWPAAVLFIGFLTQGGSKYKVVSLVALLILLSLGMAEIALDRDPESAFYLTPFRFWELGVGGSVALWASYKKPIVDRRLFTILSNVACAIAVATIAATIIWLDDEMAFPGLTVAPLVLATAVLLWQGHRSGNLVGRIFEFEPLIYIGKISYSLYLIHWLAFAGFRNYAGTLELTTTESLGLLGISFVVAAFSYHFVENPFRRKASVPTVWLTALSGALLLGITAFCVLAYDGLPGRIGDSMPKYAKDRKTMNTWQIEWTDPRQTIGPKNQIHRQLLGAPWDEAKQNWLLWGDSHADHLAQVITQAMPEQTSVLLYHWCPPFIDHDVAKRWYKKSNAWSEACGTSRKDILGWMKTNGQNVDRVILAAAWGGYLKTLYAKDPAERTDGSKALEILESALENTLAAIPSDLPVLILTELPRPFVTLLHCVNGQQGIFMRRPNGLCGGLPREDIDRYHRGPTEVLLRVARKHQNVQVIDLVDRLCDSKRCDVFVHGELIYRDTNHLRMNLSPEIRQNLADRIGLSHVFATPPGS